MYNPLYVPFLSIACLSFLAFGFQIPLFEFVFGEGRFVQESENEPEPPQNRAAIET